MKKYVIMLAIIGFVTTILFGCGNSNENSVTGANGKTYDSYREACRDGDFEAAHKFLDKKKEETRQAYEHDWSHKYEIKKSEIEAEDYIYKQEALFLMGQNDDAAKKRLIYLIKEEERSDELIGMIIDLAIEENDVDFVKKLGNQYSGEVNDESLKKISDYLFSKSSQENVEYVITLLRKVGKESLLLDDALVGPLAKINNTEISDLLLSSLTYWENDIPSRPDIGLVKAEESDFKSDKYGSHGPYIIKTKKYNNKCRTILNMAIASKNQYLAKESLSKIRPTLSYKNLGDWEHVVVKSRYTSSYNAYRITISNEDINSAKTVYQQAVRNGVFK